MRFTWRSDKAARNLKEKGIGFERASAVWMSNRVDAPSPRLHSDERRRQSLGRVDGHVLALVYVMLDDDLMHVISLRRASRQERRKYAEAFPE